MEFEEIEGLVDKWAVSRGIHSPFSKAAQIAKLTEEFAELQLAMLNDDEKEIYDALGDMLVVMTNIATNYRESLVECYEQAYNQIKDRKGKMVNGTFVKES